MTIEDRAEAWLAAYIGRDAEFNLGSGAVRSLLIRAFCAGWNARDGRGVPIGVNDVHDKPIHIGDRLRFDEREFGERCEFVVELRDGQIQHPGATFDLSSWCEVIERWDHADVADPRDAFRAGSPWFGSMVAPVAKRMEP